MESVHDGHAIANDSAMMVVEGVVSRKSGTTSPFGRSRTGSADRAAVGSPGAGTGSSRSRTHSSVAGSSEDVSKDEVR